MLLGSWKTATIEATPATTSDEVNLGRQYGTVIIVCPALTTSATVAIQGAEKTGGTFQNIHITDPASGNNKQVITAAFTTANFIWVAPIGGVQFIKLVLSAAQAAAKTFRVRGVKN